MILHFLFVYSFLFVLGIGYAKYLMKGTIQLSISPLIGYSIISILSDYFLRYELNRIYLFFIIGILALLSILLTFRTKAEYQLKNIPYLGLFVFLIVCFKLNNYFHGTLLFGVNPDIAAYIASGDWLDKLMPLSSLFHATSGQYEVLYKAHRWAIPMHLSIFSLLTKETSAAFIFPLTAIMYFSSIWTTVELFNNHYKQFKYFTLHCLIAILCINASLLFLIYEGFYPNVIGLGLFSVLCVFLGQHFDRKIIIANMLILAALISTYSEVFLVYVLIIGLYMLINSIQTQNLFHRENILNGLICLGGFLIVFPLSFTLIQFSVANLANMNNVGFPQPTWIAPSDVVGLTNIYNNYQDYLAVQVHVIGRNEYYLAMTLFFSLWVTYELIKQLKYKLLLATVILSLVIFGDNYFRFIFGYYPPVNYLYDKIVLILASVITLYFYLSIAHHKYKLFMAFIFSIISTLSFLSPDNLQFRSRLYFKEMKTIISKYENKNVSMLSNTRGLRLGIEVPQLRYVDRVHDIIWGEYSINRELDQWNVVSCTVLQPTSSIILIAQKRTLSNPAYTYKNLLFETKHYIVIDTKKTIKEVCKKNFDKNIAALYII